MYDDEPLLILRDIYYPSENLTKVLMIKSIKLKLVM